MDDNQEVPESQQAEDLPQGQVWFDKIILLLALSIIVTALVYNGWGLWELFR